MAWRFEAMVMGLALSTAGCLLPSTAQAATIVTFTGEGVGENDPVGGGPSLGRVANRVSGSFSFDASTVESFGSGVQVRSFGTSILGVQTDFFARVLGDVLIFDVTNLLQMGFTDRDIIFLRITFRDGTLNNAFPTTANFSDVISSSFGATSLLCAPRCEFQSSSGALTALNISTNATPAPFARADIFVSSGTVRAVPEPGTWATMLLGFGAVGTALRRRAPRRLATA